MNTRFEQLHSWRTALIVFFAMGLLAAELAAGEVATPLVPNATTGDTALAQQLSQLQAKMSQLEATLAKNAPAAAPAAAMSGMAPPAGPMAGMTPPAIPAGPMAGMTPQMDMMAMMSKMMGMMDKMMPMKAMPPGGEMDGMKPMAGMSPPAGPMKDMNNSAAPMSMGTGMAKMEMMGMMGMGNMAASTGAMSQNALPGFPGASHLYHIGSTGFFLDHPTHITLTTAQQAALNQAKEQALLAKSTADRASMQAEQELWALTALDQPDAAKIEAKIREIEKVKGDERLAFIRAVGDASKILTDEQRKVLTGFAQPAAAPAAAMAPMKGM